MTSVGPALLAVLFVMAPAASLAQQAHLKFPANDAAIVKLCAHCHAARRDQPDRARNQPAMKEGDGATKGVGSTQKPE